MHCIDELDEDLAWKHIGFPVAVSLDEVVARLEKEGIVTHPSSSPAAMPTAWGVPRPSELGIGIIKQVVASVGWKDNRCYTGGRRGNHDSSITMILDHNALPFWTSQI